MGLCPLSFFVFISIVRIIASSAMPIAILLCGPLADFVSVEAILLWSGVLLAMVGAVYHGYSKRVPVWEDGFAEEAE